MFDTREATQVLEAHIAKGQTSALNVIKYAKDHAPVDAIIKGTDVQVVPSDAGLVTRGGKRLHKNALQQIAARASIPAAYLADLAAGRDEKGKPAPWKMDLASRIIAGHYSHTEASNRFLIRAVDGEIKGFLSDRYRRLDSRPLIDAFAAECETHKAVPVAGHVGDVRIALKAIIPQVFALVITLGVEWGNSDFGAARHTVRPFILRVACLNGATATNALAETHLGRQLSDDIEFSNATYELDTKTSVSAMRDVLRNILKPVNVQRAIASLEMASGQSVEWNALSRSLAKRLLKGELAEAKAAFEGNDTHNLPEGKNMWRASNAVSWIAHSATTEERRLELQRIAGELIDGKTDRD